MPWIYVLTCGGVKPQNFQSLGLQRNLKICHQSTVALGDKNYKKKKLSINNYNDSHRETLQLHKFSKGDDY